MPVPVTEEEMRSPLFPYFQINMTPADPARYQAVEAGMMDPRDALLPQDMNRLFDPGYLPGEFGYTQLEDGTVTLANLTKMPNVTPEMFDWWFAWHGLESLRYKIWNKDEHHYCQTRNTEQARNASLSMKERYWDTVHDVKEAMAPDAPVQDLIINFRNPVDIGFSAEKLKDFDGTIVCAGNEVSPTIMCHFIRPTADGCELRTRFWMGYCVKDRKPVKAIPDGIRIPPEAAKALLLHNIKEFTNLAALLPKLYPEYKDRF